MEIGNLTDDDMAPHCGTAKQKLKVESQNQLKKIQRRSNEANQDERVGGKCAILQRGRKNMNRRTARKMLEYIDQHLLQILIQVEKGLPKVKPWEYSPRLVQATLVKAYWSTVVASSKSMDPIPEESIRKIKELLGDVELLEQGDAERKPY